MADCDFCAAAQARWFLPAKDGARPMPGHQETGWRACATCYQLVGSEDRAGLLQRSYVELVPRLPVREGASMSRKVRRAAERDVAKLHADFWRQREGGAVPV